MRQNDKRMGSAASGPPTLGSARTAAAGSAAATRRQDASDDHRRSALDTRRCGGADFKVAPSRIRIGENVCAPPRGRRSPSEDRTSSTSSEGEKEEDDEGARGECGNNMYANIRHNRTDLTCEPIAPKTRQHPSHMCCPCMGRRRQRPEAPAAAASAGATTAVENGTIAFAHVLVGFALPPAPVEAVCEGLLVMAAIQESARRRLGAPPAPGGSGLFRCGPGALDKLVILRPSRRHRAVGTWLAVRKRPGGVVKVKS